MELEDTALTLIQGGDLMFQGMKAEHWVFLAVVEAVCASVVLALAGVLRRFQHIDRWPFRKLLAVSAAVTGIGLTLLVPLQVIYGEAGPFSDIAIPYFIHPGSFHIYWPLHLVTLRASPWPVETGHYGHIATVVIFFMLWEGVVGTLLASAQWYLIGWIFDRGAARHGPPETTSAPSC